MSVPARHIDPLRRHGRLDREARRRRQHACEKLRQEITRTDSLLAKLGARRHRLALELAEHRDQLYPRDARRFGRRPGPGGTVQLPPLAANPTKLRGRRLRGVCLAIMKLAGESTLGELHAQLHHRGYEIDCPQPVKALADALGYETDRGCARRVSRGVYAAVGGTAAIATLQDIADAA